MDKKISDASVDALNELESWTARALDYLRQEHPEQRRSYGGARNTRSLHYFRTARVCVEKYPVLAVGQAAFLHGLLPDVWRKLPAEILPDNARRILTVREGLRQLATLSDRPFRLPDNVTVDEDAALAALLHIVEQLDHWDPDQAIHRWSMEFRVGRVAMPPLPFRPLHTQRQDTVRSLRDGVAPVAELLGFWEERNTARNLAFGAEHPEMLELVVEAAADRALAAELDSYVACIRAALYGAPLPAGLTIESVEWNWRHAASIFERLPDQLPRDLSKEMVRHGFVTVRYRLDEGVPPEAGWQLVGRLHQCFPRRPRAMRDHTRTGADPHRPGSGYVGLHTELDLQAPPRPAGARERRAVAVRVIAPESSSLPTLDDLVARLERLRAPSIGVYTPSGELKELPIGSAVLNFAAKVHDDFVSRLAGATVNGKPATALTPLNDGDQVHLELSQDLVDLPADWESHVPASTTYELRQSIRPAHRTALNQEGRRIISLYARERGYPEILQSEGIDVAVDRAAERLSLRAANDAPKQYWLRQLAALDRRERGRSPIEMITLRPAERDELLREIIRVISQEVYLTPEHIFPEESADLPKDWCPDCRPDAVGSLDSELRHGRIIIHRSGAQGCSLGPVQAVAEAARPRLHQWIYVKTHPRHGIALDLTRVFYDLEISAGEIVARHISTQEGVFRFEIEAISPVDERRLRTRLMAVGGVNAVLRNGEMGAETMERLLPATRFGPSLIVHPAHCVGGGVYRDEEFYGREALLNVLFNEADWATTEREANGQKNNGIYVYGSFRVGKSSLILRFRHLNERRVSNVLVVYVEARTPAAGSPGETWSRFAVRLRQAWLDRLREYARVTGAAWPVSESADSPPTLDALGNLTASLPGSPRIVLAVDEAVSLISATERARGEWDQFREDVDTVLRRPRQTMIWVGPPVPGGDDRAGASLEGTRDFLGHCAQVAIGPFAKWETTADVVRSVKNAPRPRRRIPNHVAKAIHELTGGEPIWVQAIARELEKVVAPRADSPYVEFTLLHVEKVAARVIRERQYFQPRTADNGAREDWVPGMPSRVIWDVLVYMAERPVAEFTPLAELLAFVGIDGERLRTMMNALEAMGSVQSADDNALAWRLHAPILHRYVRRFGLSARQGSQDGSR